ncbi:MAG: hypothetical protein ACK5JS_04650 [Mangrovibacterium sp.]
MKQLVLLAFIALGLVSCGSSSKQTEKTIAEIPAKQYEAFDLNDYLQVAETKIGDTITVRGYVTHTCKHSGKRCFITGGDKNSSFRVEAKGEIGGFNRELTGSLLAITGVAKERRLTQEYLDQTEKDLEEKVQTEDGSAESCHSELKNIAAMREKMTELGKDYYAIYYMDGLSYEVIEE